MKFSGDELLETAPKLRKRKKNSSSCVYVLHKTCRQEISRPSRVASDGKEMYLHVQSCCFGCKTYCFCDVLVVVDVALLELPNEV